jgi:competence protein ComGF
MKAEEFLESYAISDLDVFGRHEEHYSLDNLLNEYARIQIEKDRERIKANINFNDDGIKQAMEKVIDNTPINLD